MADTTISARHSPAPHRASPIEIAFRCGYAAHGAVYGLVAILALDAAFGGGGQVEGGKGALTSIADSGWGTALLVAIGVGLIAYGIMRLWQGIGDPAGHGTNARGLAVRAGRVGSAVAQLALAFYALSLAFGWFGGGGSGGAGGEGVRDLTARVMSWPAGRWIVGLLGAAIVGGGLRQLQKAITADFMDELAVSGQRQRWVEPTGRAGFAARFVVFTIIGTFLIVAAVQAQPGEAEGIGGALRTLQDQPFGPWLLGLVALGLLAFAVTRGIFARYRRIPHKS